MKTIVVAIDGYSGCGKSSTAKGVAKALDFTYIDSGAMYRAATLYFIRRGIPPDNQKEIELHAADLEIDFIKDDQGITHTFLGKENVEGEIRKMEVSGLVSQYSKIPSLRKAMVELQRKMSKNKNVIMDGRDIGTVVFPNADLKIFMTADVEVRARRRQDELALKGQMEEFETIKRNLQERDEMDTKRAASPLEKAKDAVEIDTSHISLDEQIDLVINLVKQKQENQD